jgi:glycosyltransferase involved in cell wall biosynthesis
MTGDLPLLSVILPTRDRPDLLAVALECFRRQTYPHRDLIVVDDGDAAPVDRSAVRAAGGRLVRVRPGTPLGTKLNLGIDATDGPLCQILDDAAWYAPTFLDTMVRSLLGHWTTAYQPAIATIAPHLVFLLPNWLVGRTAEVVPAAGSLLFQREDWDERPFRPSDADVGAEYLRDQYELGITGLAVHAVESCLAVHLGGEDGPDTRLLDLEMYGFGMPESILPDWALRTYRHLDARSQADVEVGCPG